MGDFVYVIAATVTIQITIINKIEKQCYELTLICFSWAEMVLLWYIFCGTYCVVRNKVTVVTKHGT